MQIYKVTTIGMYGNEMGARYFTSQLQAEQHFDAEIERYKKDPACASDSFMEDQWGEKNFSELKADVMFPIQDNHKGIRRVSIGMEWCEGDDAGVMRDELVMQLITIE